MTFLFTDVEGYDAVVGGDNEEILCSAIEGNGEYPATYADCRDMARSGVEGSHGSCIWVGRRARRRAVRVANDPHVVRITAFVECRRCQRSRGSSWCSQRLP